MLFDSHTHINFKAFGQDRDEVLTRSGDSGMRLMQVGAAFDTSKEAVAIAEKYDFCYASVGLHPIHVYDEEFDPAVYKVLINSSSKVKAIGECGYDYWHIKRKDLPLDEIKARQRAIFEAHIDLALENDLALMVHGRNGAEEMTAYRDIYDTLQAKGVTRGTIHCFGGSVAEAKQFVRLGLFIGITGIITFDKTGRLDDIVRTIDLKHLLIETDAPYLTPVPHRGERNEPLYVAYVAKHIAQVKKIAAEEVMSVTAANANKLFAIE